MNHRNTFITVILLIICIFFQRTETILAERVSDKNFSNKDRYEKTINEALQFYKKSLTLNQDSEEAKQYLEISKSKMKIAELMLEDRLLEDKKNNLQKQLMSIQTDQLRLQDEIKKNIAQVKDKKNQDKIAEELLYKNSFDKLDEALVKINNAEDADATIYCSNLIYDARNNYDIAKKNFDEAMYNDSIAYSEKSIESAEKAFEIASSRKQKIDDLNSNLQNIFGFSSKMYDSSVILSSSELFLPLSTTIRFDLYPSLDKIAEVLSNYENINIEIESYDESKGSHKKLALSKEQSDVIKTYLNSKGFNKDIKINDKKTLPENMLSRSVNFILSY